MSKTKETVCPDCGSTKFTTVNWSDGRVENTCSNCGRVVEED